MFTDEQKQRQTIIIPVSPRIVLTYRRKQQQNQP